MFWNYFAFFAFAAVLLWTLGAFRAWRQKFGAAIGFTALGLLVFFSYILWMWIALERPPMRTQGETRLWYSFFLPLAGVIVFSRWKYRWIMSFSTVLSLVFICVNLFRPEIHSKTLMPALQSPWFAPHVIVYVFAYAILGAATLMAIYMLFFKKRRSAMADALGAQDSGGREMEACDNLVYVGVAFLTFGMLMGALWAEEAWGHYWNWDPKETWAAITWLCYLAYIHLRLRSPKDTRAALWLLLASFICLQMCWWGINYLPSAKGASIHTY